MISDEGSMFLGVTCMKRIQGGRAHTHSRSKGEGQGKEKEQREEEEVGDL